MINIIVSLNELTSDFTLYMVKSVNGNIDLLNKSFIKNNNVLLSKHSFILELIILILF